MIQDYRREADRELWLAVDYACNWIESDRRRGIFLKAFVEGEQWALDDLERHVESEERRNEKMLKDNPP